MTEAFICDAIRTPFGRYGGALASVRTDDLAALPIACARGTASGRRLERSRRCYLRLRQPGRRGQPQRRAHGRAAGRAYRRSAGRATINRLCGSSLDAVGDRRRARSAPGEAELVIAGGVESMTSRAVRAVARRTARLRAHAKLDVRHDDRLALRESGSSSSSYGVDSMPETAENVVADFAASRAPTRMRSRCAVSSVRRRAGEWLFRAEIVPSRCAGKGEPMVVGTRRASARRRHARALAKLGRRHAPMARSPPATASGVNDGGGALLIASERAASDERARAARAHRRERGCRRGRRASWASGRSPATRKLLGPTRTCVCGHRRDRAQRSLCRAVARRDAPSSGSRTMPRT